MADTVHKSVEGPAVNNQTNGLDWTWQELPVGCDCCGDGPQVGAAQVTAACTKLNSSTVRCIYVYVNGWRPGLPSYLPDAHPDQPASYRYVIDGQLPTFRVRTDMLYMASCQSLESVPIFYWWPVAKFSSPYRYFIDGQLPNFRLRTDTYVLDGPVWFSYSWRHVS